MKKSLCCISLQLQEKGFKANTMTKTRFLTLERKNALSTISQRTLNNVHVAVNTFAFCVSKGWNYRISSDLFPLATLPEANLSFDVLPDKDRIYAEFKRGAEIIKKNNVKSRLVLENEDKPNSWKVEELYDLIYSHTGIPITYDNLHFRCNSGKLSAKDAVKLSMSTWDKYRPLFHFSDNDLTNKNPRAHGDYVRSIPEEYVDMDGVDFEFEFKAKDYAIERFEKDFKL